MAFSDVDPGLAPAPMMSGPRVSIVLACRNEERTIERCLSSLLAQSYADLEVILVDSSADRTPVVVDHVLLETKSHHQVKHRFFSKPLTAAEGRNMGLDLATGEIMTFVDGDMYAEPGYVEAAVKAFGDPEVLHVCARLELLPAKTALGRYLWAYLKSFSYSPHGPWRVVTGFFRRELVSSVGRFDERLSTYEDLDYEVRCGVLNGQRYLGRYLEDAVLYHDWEDGQTFAGHFKKNAWYGAGLLRALRKHPTRLLGRMVAAIYFSFAPFALFGAMFGGLAAVLVSLPFLGAWPYFVTRALVRRVWTPRILALPLLLVFKSWGHLYGMLTGRGTAT